MKLHHVFLEDVVCMYVLVILNCMMWRNWGGFQFREEAEVFKSLGMRGKEPVGMAERPHCNAVESATCWRRESWMFDSNWYEWNTVETRIQFVSHDVNERENWYLHTNIISIGNHLSLPIIQKHSKTTPINTTNDKIQYTKVGLHENECWFILYGCVVLKWHISAN